MIIINDVTNSENAWIKKKNACVLFVLLARKSFGSAVKRKSAGKSPQSHDVESPAKRKKETHETTSDKSVQLNGRKKEVM